MNSDRPVPGFVDCRTPGRRPLRESLPAKLQWLDRIGLDGIEFLTASLANPPNDGVRIFEGSPEVVIAQCAALLRQLWEAD